MKRLGFLFLIAPLFAAAVTACVVHAQSLIRVLQSVAASNMDSTDEPIQNRMAMPKSYVRTPFTIAIPSLMSAALMFSCVAAAK